MAAKKTEALDRPPAEPVHFLQELLVTCAAITFPLTVYALLLYPPVLGVSFLLGSLFAVLSLMLTADLILALGQAKRRWRSKGAAVLLKYPVFGAAIYALHQVGVLHLLALVAGLSVLPAALVLKTLKKLYFNDVPWERREQ